MNESTTIDPPRAEPTAKPEAPSPPIARPTELGSDSKAAQLQPGSRKAASGDWRVRGPAVVAFLLVGLVSLIGLTYLLDIDGDDHEYFRDNVPRDVQKDSAARFNKYEPPDRGWSEGDRGPAQ